MVGDARITELEQADAELLDLLKRQGDQPEIVRPVDVRFKGARANLERVQATLRPGWHVLQLVECDDGWALDLQRDQRTDAGSIRTLTDEAIDIERRFGVEYDGWGCVVVTKP